MLTRRNIHRLLSKVAGQPSYAAAVAWKRFLTGICYAVGSGASLPPESVTLFLTHRCNLHCAMCGQWGDKGAAKLCSGETLSQELDFRALSELISQFSGFRPNITLFGGEPLLHRDCLAFVEAVKKNGMHCLMITNGTLLEPSAKRLVAAGLDELNISIDGYGRLHDDIRGMPGLFERVRRGVAAVNEQKRLRGARKPFINIQCTINKANYLELEKMIDTAAELGADSLTWHNLIFTTGGILDRQREVDSALESDSSSWNGFLFESGIDPEKLWSVIGRLKRRRTPLRRDVYPDFGKEDFLAYYRAPGSLTAGRRFRCLSPWLVAYVFPDGSVRPCLNSTYSFGDIRTQRFIDAWNSPAACKFRKFLKQRRVFPVCERCTELYRY